MILEVVRELYAYSTWANLRVLDTAEALDAEQFTADAGPSHGSLRNTLVHQFNHSTAHRSEAAVMLTNFGHSPGDLDYIVYLAEIEKGT